MELVCCSLEKMSKDIISNKRRIVLFGVGVIGQVTTPSILISLGIVPYIDCYVDNDEHKWGDSIDVFGEKVDVRSPNYLKSCDENTVILVNISRYVEVIEQLDSMESVQHMKMYIMPMMYIHNMCMSKSCGMPFLEDEPRIPKVIHYMWFGKKRIPDVLKRNIDSWRRLCPDYEIIEWNENNYDIYKHSYMGQAYENKAYGFIPDYARLDILYQYGGFYLDTDVELLRSLDELRYQESFVGVEKWQVLNFGGCSGAVSGNICLKKFLEAREDVEFVNSDGSLNRTTCGYYDTKTAISMGYKLDGTTQNIGEMNIYAYDYFHPYDYMSGITNITENSFSIHHFNGGWMDEKMKKQNDIAAKKYLHLYENSLIE